MLLTGREPDNISGLNHFNRATFALHASATGSDDERLSQRMRMPCRAGTGFKRDDRTSDAGGITAFER